MLKELLLTSFFFPHKNSTNGCRRREINWRMVWTKYSCTGVKVSKSLASALLYCLLCRPLLPTQCPLSLALLATPLSCQTSVPFCSDSSLRWARADICSGRSELFSLVPVDGEAPRTHSVSIPSPGWFSPSREPSAWGSLWSRKANNTKWPRLSQPRQDLDSQPVEFERPHSFIPSLFTEWLYRAKCWVYGNKLDTVLASGSSLPMGGDQLQGSLGIHLSSLSRLQVPQHGTFAVGLLKRRIHPPPSKRQGGGSKTDVSEVNGVSGISAYTCRPPHLLSLSFPTPATECKLPKGRDCICLIHFLNAST